MQPFTIMRCKTDYQKSSFVSATSAPPSSTEKSGVESWLLSSNSRNFFWSIFPHHRSGQLAPQFLLAVVAHRQNTYGAVKQSGISRTAGSCFCHSKPSEMKKGCMICSPLLYVIHNMRFKTDYQKSSFVSFTSSPLSSTEKSGVESWLLSSNSRNFFSISFAVAGFSFSQLVAFALP